MPTISRRQASSSTPRAAASPTRASAASDLPTPSPVCPIRSAPRSSSTRRSGTDRPAAAMRSRPIRWCVEAGGTLHRAGTIAELAGTDRHRAAAVGGARPRIQRRRSTPARCKCFRRRVAATDTKAWPIRTRAVLCHADLRGDHQHHGRHRGRRQRRRARPERHADAGPVRRRLHRRRVGRRTERRLRRRTDQGDHRVARRGDDRSAKPEFPRLAPSSARGAKFAAEETHHGKTESAAPARRLLQSDRPSRRLVAASERRRPTPASISSTTSRSRRPPSAASST